MRKRAYVDMYLYVAIYSTTLYDLIENLILNKILYKRLKNASLKS